MRRFISVLAVAALMTALLALTAVPAFAQGGGAVVTPKHCQPFFGLVLCQHLVTTPSGNQNYHLTFSGANFRSKSVSHIHPDNLP